MSSNLDVTRGAHVGASALTLSLEQFFRQHVWRHSTVDAAVVDRCVYFPGLVLGTNYSKTLMIDSPLFFARFDTWSPIALTLHLGRSHLFTATKHTLWLRSRQPASFRRLVCSTHYVFRGVVQHPLAPRSSFSSTPCSQSLSGLRGLFRANFG